MYFSHQFQCIGNESKVGIESRFLGIDQSLAFIFTVYGGTIAQSNHFMDDLLGSRIRGEQNSYHLEGVSVADFTLEKIKSNSLTNRDIKGNFTNGYVRGLTGVKRAGDCSPTAWIGGNITVSRFSLGL